MTLQGLQQILSKDIPLSIVTESDSLFKVFTRSSNMTEKRIMIYIQAGWEVYHDRKIDNISWVKSERNLADVLIEMNKAI